MSEHILELPAHEAARRMREGAIAVPDYAEAIQAQVAVAEELTGALAYFDPAHLAAQAERAQDGHRRGAPQGALHGLPVAVSDIFDTQDLPTGDGTRLHEGRTPRADAMAVALLRSAGALVLGKTRVSELGIGAAPETRNPGRPDVAPGFGSPGAAAAVAAGMAPLGLGSQTESGVIGPASRCGIHGFKPSHGTISRRGMLLLSDDLDQPGVFARHIADIALIAGALGGFDPDDAATRPVARAPLFEVAMSEPPLPPRLAFVPTPYWERLGETSRAAIEELVEALEGQIERLDLPAGCAEAERLLGLLAETDAALALAGEPAEGLSPALAARLARGRSHGAFDYARARRFAASLAPALDEAFFAYEAFLAPASAGPEGEGAEDAAFSAIWTLCGLPCVTLPLLQDERGRPIGVQLIGARGNDARLLRTARWLATRSFD
ncbi:MAG: amidase [Alphaproteobacteria bacterium]|nr:amidase [Alphaproteobacteria bacterium]